MPHPSDFSEDEFWKDVDSRPRGSGPAWMGEDPPSDSMSFPAEHYVDHEGPPDHHIPDPGFPEHEVDTHHDPDHGREDHYDDYDHGLSNIGAEFPEEHRIGAILRQGEQYPEARAHGQHPGDEYEDPNFYKRTPYTRVMHPEETGLEYSVIAKPNGRGGFDVIKPLG